MSTTCKNGKLNGARLADWPERLSRFIQEHQSSPFDWGSLDCARFCVKAELAMYGKTRFEDVLTGATTKRKAYKPIKANGCSNLWDFVSSRIEKLDSPLLAQRGDCVGHYVDGEQALGIVFDGKIACVGPDGIQFKPMSDAMIGWKV